MRRTDATLGIVISLVLAGCGSDVGDAPGSGGSTSVTTSVTTSGTTSGTTGAGGAGSTSAGSGGASAGSGGAVAYGRCGDEPPPGAVLAAPLPAYTGGACPALVAGTNTISSSGADRQFILAVPSDLAAGERLPVIFLWHWLGGDAQGFLDKGEIQAAVDDQRFLAILPETKGDLQFKWPVSILDTSARFEEELVFFDDMLACAAEQFAVDPQCVASAGVSAGALFTGQLAGGRGDRLSSIISLSGGVGGVIKPFGDPEHRMPALVLWGGETDECLGLLSFEKLSTDLEAALTARGHFLLECVHNCGHSPPPFDAAAGLSKYGAMWQFVFDHPFWLPAGKSSYTADGVPASMPDWCAIGAASATPRTGECLEGSGC